MVERIASIALKGVDRSRNIAVIVLNFLGSLAIGSALTQPGIGLAALALEALQKD